jgi:hypothetical protein
MKTLFKKLPARIALEISVVGLIFSPTANAQLIRQEFEGNFNLLDASPLLDISRNSIFNLIYKVSG